MCNISTCNNSFAEWTCEEDPKQYNDLGDVEGNVDNSLPFTPQGETSDNVQFTFSPDDEDGTPMAVELTTVNAETVTITDESGNVIEQVSSFCQTNMTAMQNVRYLHFSSAIL